MCGGWRRGRAARVPPRNKHRMHERGSDSTVSRWRWSFTGISRVGAGSRGYERAGDGWMGELWVIRGGQARAALLAPRKGVRAVRGHDGSVVVLAWCYPYPPGGGDGMGWSICRAVASATHHATRTFRFSDNARRRWLSGMRLFRGTWSAGVLGDLGVFTPHKVF